MLGTRFLLDRLVRAGSRAGISITRSSAEAHPVCLLGAHEMTEMRRIEGAAQDSDPHDASS